jgi:hypothetical protein
VILATLLASEKERFLAPTNIAMIYVGLHDSDKAFEWLDKAFFARDPLISTVPIGLPWTGLREDPRYAASRGDLERNVANSCRATRHSGLGRDQR